ncbi:hypothetical protein AALO_G00006900 [Alosa alosa]|uniref:Uncharacterized protein n=1 Tax=Alosa alosa TaxID=278164 RepID=A0AAV6HII8_9TELE|nr:hypothetical protein AALO_G00006900 [Alosa alosa]
MAMIEAELTDQLWGDSDGAGVLCVSRVQHLELSLAHTSGVLGQVGSLILTAVMSNDAVTGDFSLEWTV